MEESGADNEKASRIRIYAAVTLILVILALASFLIVPNTSTVKGCDALLLESSRSSCLTNLALNESEPSICAYAQGAYADSCYLLVANKTGNGKICGSIQNSSAMDSCILMSAEAKNDYALCSNATQPYASLCERTIALRLHEGALCNGITNDTTRVECTSIISMENALSLDSWKDCGNVTGSSANTNVTAYIISNATMWAGISTEYNSSLSLSAMSFLPNMTYTASDFCYSEMAAKLMNSSLCGSVSSGEARNLCIMQSNITANSNKTANYTQLLSSCSQSGVYSECVQAISIAKAVNSKNVSACSQLSNGLDTDCYTMLASTYKNASYCSYITNATKKSACISGS
jgi:hypothetical protein